MEEANKLIGAGKKHLVMGRVVEAVASLQEASGMLAKMHGDTSDKCGEAYFYYGSALLDLARMENSVLGNALEGVPQEEGEEDEEAEQKPKESNVEGTENIDEKTRDELRVQVYDAMAERTEEKDKDADNKETKEEKEEEEVVATAAAEDKEGSDNQQDAAKEGEDHTKKEVHEGKANGTEDNQESEDKEDEEAKDGEEEDGDDAEMEADAEEQGEEGDATEKDSDDENEEVGNLQLAWEMLELAKVIYTRKDTKEEQLMAAQAHLKLGEVSAESGNYTQALEDFEICLKLQTKNLEPDSRQLAETNYQMGITYCLTEQYSQAIQHLNNSIVVIKSRLEKLQELLDKSEDPQALPEERKEMEELKILLPEIQEKVDDATEGQKSAAADAVKDALDGGSSSSAFTGSAVQNGDSSKTNTTNGHASAAPAVDISHLVRKKRKPEGSPEKEGEVKKVKHDDAETDAVQHTNGDTNGHN
ncbi:nuclear autoantigenic sperm protein-like [Nelusetta ayraudi]|uniref:nuclear autoantigenic sperm protein-like n=1 Tax=Nelusetta ayraudi TaxID=303726 RepID=UPI003F723FEB